MVAVDVAVDVAVVVAAAVVGVCEECAYNVRDAGENREAVLNEMMTLLSS